MKTKSILLFIAIALICGQFFSSCSNSLDLAKRKHRSGFYVNLSKNKKKELDKNRLYIHNTFTTIQETNNEDIINLYNNDESLIASNENIVLPENHKTTKIFSVETKNKEDLLNYKKPAILTFNNDTIPNNLTREVPIAGINSLFYGIVSLVCLPIITGFALTLGLKAIRLGKKSNKLIKENPELYKGKGFGTAGIIIASITIVILSLVALLGITLLALYIFKVPVIY